MPFEIYYTAAVIILMSIALAIEIYKPSIVVFAALLLLVIGNIISIDEAFAGFSNKGMLAVAFLFVVSASLQSSGAFEKIITNILGRGNGRRSTRYFKLMFPVAFFSAFLNNTPIVASLIPVIKKWAQRNNLAASKFLIPLSYASILGGVCTLIGTSTNLVVHGLLLERGLDGFSFFELTKIGVPVAVIGIGFVAVVGHRLLPRKKDPMAQLGEHTREFVVEMKVSAEYPALIKTIEQANLRHLQGLFLFQIIRNAETIAPIAPDENILEHDRLFFTGLPETIYELQKTPGLNVIKDSEFNLKNIDSDEVKTYEAVVSSTSPLISQSVRESNFRTKYDAVILAIHRSGSRVNKKVGDIIFRPGDTLFLLAKKGFSERWYHNVDFSLVSSSIDIYAKPKWKGNIALVLLLLMIAAAVLNLMPMIVAAAITAVIMVVTKVISVEDAQNSVKWNVLAIIACSFGIGKALENSGLSNIIADFIIHISSSTGALGAIAAIFIITSAYTIIITNNAVAAIMFPVALSTAEFLNIDPKPIMLVLALASSTCFASPIGYQTNLMVFNPGSYKFMDFFKLGMLMNILVGTAVIIIISFLFNF